MQTHGFQKQTKSRKILDGQGFLLYLCKQKFFNHKTKKQTIMKENKPLVQNGEIILYQPDSSIRLEVRMEEDTVWLNRQQMARLFDRDVKTIGKHINNALKEELSDYPVVAKFATTASDGKTYQVDYYNLDVILSVGYRVKSKRGIEFRRWTNFRRLRLRGGPYPVGTETHHPHRQLHRRLGAADAGKAEGGRGGRDCHKTRLGNAETRPGKA